MTSSASNTLNPLIAVPLTYRKYPQYSKSAMIGNAIGLIYAALANCPFAIYKNALVRPQPAQGNPVKPSSGQNVLFVSRISR